MLNWIENILRNIVRPSVCSEKQSLDVRSQSSYLLVNVQTAAVLFY